jgi:hypothetical protein
MLYEIKGSGEGHHKIKYVDNCMKYVYPNFDVHPHIIALWNARLVDLLE